MRKKRFLAIAAAIAISISCAAPVSVSATEVDEEADTIDDEQEEGEQTTIVAPGAESEDTGDDSGSAGGSSSGSTGGSSAGTGSSSGTSSSTGSTKSSDSSLSHLGISPGSLSPAFSAGTHEYTATVDAGVTAISVAAKPNNSKAVIASVSGAKSLSPGSNTVKVVVEAENGATTTYTITVNCGSSSAPAQTTAQEDTSGVTASEDGEQVLEGEISTIEDTVEEKKEESEVTFDDNGYLIYEGNAYLPSSMMPEGEYVSLDKYNKLYEQSQAQKTKNTRMLIIFVVVLLLLLIVILNLALKLRDLHQDMKLGLDGVRDDEEPEKKQTDTSMIPDVKMPEPTKPSKTEKLAKAEKPARAEKPAKAEKPARAEKPVKAEKPARAEKPVKAEKPARAEKPSKPAASKPAKKAEDLEILDLNDL